jgi:hypothetical protein
VTLHEVRVDVQRHFIRARGDPPLVALLDHGRADLAGRVAEGAGVVASDAPAIVIV